jgi:hypothetical protein
MRLRGPGKVQDIGAIVGPLEAFQSIEDRNLDTVAEARTAWRPIMKHQITETMP